MPENATPAPTTGTSPVVAPPPPQQTRSTKTYATHKTPRISANPAPAPAATGSAATPAPAPTTGAQTPAATPPTTPVAATTETPAPTPKPGETPAATPPAPKLSAFEESKRVAQLVRTEGKLVAEKQRIAQERQAIENERQANATALQRIKAMEQARNVPKGQRLGFIKQVFGWQPQDVIEDVVADSARTPEQVAQGQLSQIEARTLELNKKIDEYAQREESERLKARQQDFITNTLEPLLSPTNYPFLCNALGKDAAKQMFAVMNTEWQKSHHDVKQRRAPDPKDLATRAEAWYRKDAEAKAKLLGLSVTPQQTVNQTAQGGTAITPTTQATSVSRSARFQAAPTYRAKHRAG